MVDLPLNPTNQPTITSMPGCVYSDAIIHMRIGVAYMHVGASVYACLCATIGGVYECMYVDVYV